MGEAPCGVRNRQIREMEVLTVKPVAKKTAVLVLVFMALLVAHAGASSPAKPEALTEKWVFYETDEDGTSYFYDAGNIQRLKGGLVLVWVQAVYTDKNPKFREGRFLWEVDCSKKRMRGLTAYVTKKDGIKETITQSSDWSPIPADSTAETLHGLVCKKKEKKAAAAPAH